jgi:hypothetical protein
MDPAPCVVYGRCLYTNLATYRCFVNSGHYRRGAADRSLMGPWRIDRPLERRLKRRCAGATPIHSAGADR